MKTILDEIQQDRNIELSNIYNLDFEVVKGLEICNPDYIKIFNKEKDKYPIEPKDFYDFYINYNNLNFIGYLKTLMFTSVNRRGNNLRKNLNCAKGNCLDFGSGVGTHAIYMMQKNNKTWVFDLLGKLLQFTLDRIKYRKIPKTLFKSIFVTSKILPENFFNYINCLDVLEHCFDPLEELKIIYKSLKDDGILHLQVSEMIKPESGHFKESIEKWKTEGKDFLNDYFYQEDVNLYRKR